MGGGATAFYLPTENKIPVNNYKHCVLHLYILQYKSDEIIQCHGILIGNARVKVALRVKVSL